MTQVEARKRFARRRLLGGLALLAFAQPAWAILGVWRRAARRTVFVAGAATASVVATEAAASNAAAAASAQSAADASAAAARQAQESANQAASQANTAKATKTPQQKLQELQSLYDQKLISASDYEAGKKKILSEVTN